MKKLKNEELEEISHGCFFLILYAHSMMMVLQRFLKSIECTFENKMIDRAFGRRARHAQTSEYRWQNFVALSFLITT
jgi:hypothetical protein